MIALAFLDRLTGSLADELQQLVAGIRSFLLEEHREDGSHAAVTADSLEIREDGELRLSGDRTDQGHDVVASNDSDGNLTTTFIGVARWLRQGIELLALGRTVLGVETETQLSKKTAILGALRVQGQSSYEVAIGDTAALATSGEATPAYSFYHLTAAANRTLYGIYADVATGARGQVLFLHNDSAFTITFGTGLVSNGRKILSPLLPYDLLAGHSLILVYDTAGLGWRIVGAA